MGEHFLDAYRYSLMLDDEVIAEDKIIPTKLNLPWTESKEPELVTFKPIKLKCDKKLLRKLLCGYKGHDRFRQKMRARQMTLKVFRYEGVLKNERN